jgi:hypothetical protein
MGIDDVTCARDAQQFADTSGGGLIQGSDPGAAEQASQVRLPRNAAPHLGNDPTAGDHGCATHLVTGHQRHFTHDRVHALSFCCDTRDTWRQQAAAQHTLRNAFPVEVWRNAAEVERPAGTEDQAQIDIHRR